MVNFDNYHSINEFKNYIKTIKRLYYLIKEYKEKKLLTVDDIYFNDLSKHVLYNYTCFSKINTYNSPKDKILFNYLCKNIDIPIIKFNI